MHGHHGAMCVRMWRQSRLESVGQHSSSPPPLALPCFSGIAINVPNIPLRSMPRISVFTPHCDSSPACPYFSRNAINVPIITVQPNAQVPLYAMRRMREWCRSDRMVVKAAATTRTRKEKANGDGERSYARSRPTREASSPQRSSLRAASLRVRRAEERRTVNRRSEFVFGVLSSEGNTRCIRRGNCKGTTIF